MAGYNHANLRIEIDDQAPNLGYPPHEVELRMGRAPLDCKECGISYMRIAPGYRQPVGHSHNRQEEVYVLVSGSGRIKVDDEIVDLQPWSAIRISPETVRCIEAGPEGAEFVCVGAPNTGPGDGNVIHGWWSD